jgi:gliding motility-associated lipoprotein GldH
MVQLLPLKLKLGLIFLVAILVLAACGDSSVTIDETKSFNESGWIQKQPIRFQVNILDAGIPYAMYVVVRQNNSYPFYNLYFSPSILDERGKIIQRGLAEAILYDPKTGKPKGDGFGDLYEKKFLVYSNLKFPQKGKYQIQLEQSMRVDTLAGMVSMGLFVEKK